MRVKGHVIHSETERMEKLFFMALCGTDYNIVPSGLGMKRLLTGVLANSELFSKWCKELNTLLWGAAEQPLVQNYYTMGMQLANFTKIPRLTQSKDWTEAKCELMFKTMKYVCDLWNLAKPAPGPQYGFSVLEGVATFNVVKETE